MDLLVQNLTIDLIQKYNRNKRFKEDFIYWYVNEQGWTFVESDLEENVERAAKLGAYILIIKLVFYEALRKKFTELPALNLKETKNFGSQLKEVLNRYFKLAVKTSGDYETVYGFGFGDELPFCSNQTVSHWKELVEQIHDFDFTKLDYEVIGLMFQRLISPKERHKYGQHYTRSDVVDLILAFGLQNGGEIVMDPACGGGTFLVRAYNRLKYLNPKLSHLELLDMLYGVDLASFPVKLAIMNIASKQLVEDNNYPRIFRKDFFDVKSNLSLGQLPNTNSEKGRKDIITPQFHAFVGNLPYIRQELIPSMDNVLLAESINSDISSEQKSKPILASIIANDTKSPNLKISKRSDLHCYFWFHCYPFIKNKSIIAFLTSSMWLDNDYGFDLQKYFLDKFEIVALIESKIERWFPDANVATTITVLRKQDDKNSRKKNIVKFVQILVPLASIIEANENDTQRWNQIEDLVGKIDACKKITYTNEYKIFPVNQKELYESSFNEEGVFVGSNWSKYIRAPEIYFYLRKVAQKQFVKVSELAETRFGVKTGANDFFYVRDITDSFAGETLKEYGIYNTEKLRLIESVDGSYHIIESEYLHPIIFSLKEMPDISIKQKNLSYKIISSDHSKSKLQGSYLLKYIKIGEKNKYHLRPTCSARNPWYNVIKDWKPAPLVLPSKIGERFLVAENKDVLEDKKQYGISPFKKKNTKILAALMNSTFFRFFLEFESRQMTGAQAISDIDVKVVANAYIPNIDKLKYKDEILNAYSKLKKREIHSIFSEIIQDDRKKLDETILKGIGITEKSMRKKILSEVYESITDYVKARIVRAESVKKKSKKVKINPRIIASELLLNQDLTKYPKFPDSFLKGNEKTETIHVTEFDIQIGDDIFTQGTAYSGNQVIKLGSKARAEYLQILARNKRQIELEVPIDEQICESILKEYLSERKKLILQFTKLASSRTNDPKLSTNIVHELLIIIHFL